MSDKSPAEALTTYWGHNASLFLPNVTLSLSLQARVADEWVDAVLCQTAAMPQKNVTTWNLNHTRWDTFDNVTNITTTTPTISLAVPTAPLSFARRDMPFALFKTTVSWMPNGTLVYGITAQLAVHQCMPALDTFTIGSLPPESGITWASEQCSLQVAGLASSDHYKLAAQSITFSTTYDELTRRAQLHFTIIFWPSSLLGGSHLVMDVDTRHVFAWHTLARGSLVGFSV